MTRFYGALDANPWVHGALTRTGSAIRRTRSNRTLL